MNIEVRKKLVLLKLENDSYEFSQELDRRLNCQSSDTRTGYSSNELTSEQITDALELIAEEQKRLNRRKNQLSKLSKLLRTSPN